MMKVLSSRSMKATYLSSTDYERTSATSRASSGREHCMKALKMCWKPPCSRNSSAHCARSSASSFGDSPICELALFIKFNGAGMLSSRFSWSTSYAPSPRVSVRPGTGRPPGKSAPLRMLTCLGLPSPSSSTACTIWIV